MRRYSEDRDKLTKSKREGERTLKNSGLGYTILRPGDLLAGAYTRPLLSST